MIKKYKHSQKKIMRRSARVFLNDLNEGKVKIITEFLHLCHDVIQYFVDLFWQRKDFSAKLADLETIHRGRDRFDITTRLAQALAKQAKEIIRNRKTNRKPRLHHHTINLYYHFVKIELFDGSFDYAVKLIGSGAPRMVIPVNSTKPINKFIKDGWEMAKTVRFGIKAKKLFVDFIFEKLKPALKEQGQIVGMDSNYKNGFVFSDGQVVGQDIYNRIQSFYKRQKNTHVEVKSLIGYAVNQIDFSNIKMLCIENLKKVKQNKRGKFPRIFNRRLSHWLYAYMMDLQKRRCEESGVRLARKSPAYTSQFCRICHKWDRRSRVGDRFSCVHCGFSNHADLNASQNLALLGEAGIYGLRSLPNLMLRQRSQSFG